MGYPANAISLDLLFPTFFILLITDADVPWRLPYFQKSALLEWKDIWKLF